MAVFGCGHLTFYQQYKQTQLDVGLKILLKQL